MLPETTRFPVRLILQLRDLGRKLALDERRVLPPHALERRRDDVLLLAVVRAAIGFSSGD